MKLFQGLIPAHAFFANTVYTNTWYSWTCNHPANSTYIHFVFLNIQLSYTQCTLTPGIPEHVIIRTQYNITPGIPEHAIVHTLCTLTPGIPEHVIILHTVHAYTWYSWTCNHQHNVNTYTLYSWTCNHPHTVYAYTWYYAIRVLSDWSALISDKAQYGRHSHYR